METHASYPLSGAGRKGRDNSSRRPHWTGYDGRAEMLLPWILFVSFALLSAVGAYLALAYTKSRAAGAWGALLTLLFFAVLAVLVLALLRDGGFA